MIGQAEFLFLSTPNSFSPTRASASFLSVFPPQLSGRESSSQERTALRQSGSAWIFRNSARAINSRTVKVLPLFLFLLFFFFFFFPDLVNSPRDGAIPEWANKQHVLGGLIREPGDTRLFLKGFQVSRSGSMAKENCFGMFFTARQESSKTALQKGPVPVRCS
jgi:hypothetical protein